jgi:hypothetical protein
VIPAGELAERAARPSRRRPTARAAEAGTEKPAPHAEERAHWRRVFGVGDDGEGR